MKPPHEFKIMRVRECVATEIIDTPDSAAQYWLRNIPESDWYDEAKEAVVVLILNTRRRIMGHNLVTLGSLDTCLIHAREVFRPAIVAAGSAVILMHNHPSGDSTPSEADIKVTRELIKAGQLLKIELLDHVIMGQRITSLKTQGYFY
jgi:DNA repair protein RadC